MFASASTRNSTVVRRRALHRLVGASTKALAPRNGRLAPMFSSASHPIGVLPVASITPCRVMGLHSHNTRRSFSQARHKEQQTVTLSSSQAAIDDLLRRLKAMESVSSGEKELLINLLNESREILNSIIFAVEQCQLNPSGKHGKGISDIMERILRSYRRICTLAVAHEEKTLACFEYCQEALLVMATWNLNFRHSHYDHAIVVASREERWKEASDLFFEKIDPSAAYNPVQVSVSNPEGLYAIVRLAQQEKSPVAELVFDAVLQLSMVSPQDQTTYILAAGTALGKAGEWASAVDFLMTSYSAKQLGLPLVSSVMQACLLSGRPEEALRVYEEKFGDVGERRIAEEWQWGGNRDTLDPLTRDLLIRTARARTGLSSLALDLFKETIDEGQTVSIEALLGVLESCEIDRNIEGSLSVLDRILDNASRDDWIVSGMELVIPNCDSEDAKRLSGGTVASRWLAEMSNHVASVMRCCNSVSSFGTSLYYIHRMGQLVPDDHSKPAISMDRRSSTAVHPTVELLANTLSSLRRRENLLVPTMVALSGLRCYDDALQLCDLLVDDQCLPQAAMIREYTESEMAKHGKTVVGNSWTSADRHIHRLLAALQFIQDSGSKLTKTDESKIFRGLAVAMQSCTSAHQPDLSLRLLSYVADSLRRIRGYDLTNKEKNDWSDLELVHDGLSAEIIHALVWSNNLVDAVDLFRVIVDQEPSKLSQWRSSCSAGLSALVKLGRGDEAVKIFNELPMTTLSPDCYIQIGKHLLSTENTKELGDLYSTALNNGHLSDELTLLTMIAVVRSKPNNRVRVLRVMVDDNAKFLGIDRDAWMRARYWQVKKALGFLNARLLMWWNDPETCHLDELEFAISECKTRTTQGLKVRNDAVRTIVNHARLFNESSIPRDSSRWKYFLPRTKDEFIMLVLGIVQECESSPIINDPWFIESVVSALRNLDGNKECVTFVTTVLDRGIRVEKSTLSRALEAATLAQTPAVASDLRMLMSEVSYRDLP